MKTENMAKSQKTYDWRSVRNGHGNKVLRTYLLDGKLLGGVSLLPVAKLVGEDGNDLLDLALLNQGVKDDNVLAPGKAVKVGVAMRATLGTVDNIEVLEGELESCSESLHLSLELSILKRRELVKQGLDKDRIGSDQEGLDSEDKQPQVVEEVRAKVSNNLEESGENRRPKGNNQDLRLDEVGAEQSGGLLVEAKLLLEDKVLVPLEREVCNVVGDGEGGKEDDGLRDLAAEGCGRITDEDISGDFPELGKDVVLVEEDGADVAIEGADKVELGLCASVGLFSESATVSGELCPGTREPETCRTPPG